MNWYSLIKIAQIWAVDWEEEDFESMLRALYELEYKYSMAKTRKFNGHPKRRENIFEHLKQEFLEVASVVQNVLIQVFKKWLSSHALTDPQQWAAARLRDNTDLEYHEDTGENILGLFENMFYEYADRKGIKLPSSYGGKTHIEPFFRQTWMQDIMPRINDFPELQKILELYLEDYKEMLQGDLADEGFEEFGKRMGQSFMDESTAYNWIGHLGTDSIDIADYIDSLDTLVSAATNAGNWVEVIEELYAKLVFPAWYNIWYQQGIKETRANIEKVYGQLTSAGTGTPEQLSMAINIALNAAHQNGSMLEYVENDTGSNNLKDILSSLSSIDETRQREWNQDLYNVGFDISQPKQQTSYE